MEAGFSEQGADWQANYVSWISHYTPPPPTHTQTPSVAPSLREIPCVDAQQNHVCVQNLFPPSAIIQMSSLHSLNN